MIELIARRWKVLLAVIAVCAVMAIFVKPPTLSYPAALAALCLLCGMGWIIAHLARDSWNALPVTARFILRKLVRSRRRLQRLYQPSPMIRFLAPLTLASCIAAVAIVYALPLLMHRQYSRIDSLVWFAPLVLMIPLGAFECMQRFFGLTRLAWAQATGKLVMAGVAAIAYVVAHMLAARLVFNVSQLDQKYYGDFINLVALLLVPALYVYALAVIAAIYIMIEWIAFWSLLLVSGVADSLSTAVGIRAKKAKTFLLRLACGARFASSTNLQRLKTVVLLGLRILAMLMCLISVWGSTADIARHVEPAARRFLTAALVMTEYRHGRFCSSLEPAYFLPLDGGTFSVAHRVPNGFDFGITRCTSSVTTAGSVEYPERAIHHGQ